jgi:hypothetical protein
MIFDPDDYEDNSLFVVFGAIGGIGLIALGVWAAIKVFG